MPFRGSLNCAEVLTGLSVRRSIAISKNSRTDTDGSGKHVRSMVFVRIRLSRDHLALEKFGPKERYVGSALPAETLLNHIFTPSPEKSTVPQ